MGIIKAQKAYELIRSLILLGSTELEMANTIRLVGFDKAEKTYPKLEKKLKQARDRLGLSDDEQFKFAITALDFDRIIEIAELRVHAMRTADRHLTNTSQETFVP